MFVAQTCPKNRQEKMQYSGDPYMGDKMNRIWMKNYFNVGGIGDFGQLHKDGFALSEAILPPVCKVRASLNGQKNKK
jgi:hypothetical protein